MTVVSAFGVYNPVLKTASPVSVVVATAWFCTEVTAPRKTACASRFRNEVFRGYLLMDRDESSFG